MFKETILFQSLFWTLIIYVITTINSYNSFFYDFIKFISYFQMMLYKLTLSQKVFPLDNTAWQINKVNYTKFLHS